MDDQALHQTASQPGTADQSVPGTADQSVPGTADQPMRGRVALVAGASKGIGAATAEAFAAAWRRRSAGRP